MLVAVGNQVVNDRQNGGYMCGKVLVRDNRHMGRRYVFWVSDC